MMHRAGRYSTVRSAIPQKRVGGYTDAGSSSNLVTDATVGAFRNQYITEIVWSTGNPHSLTPPIAAGRSTSED